MPYANVGSKRWDPGGCTVDTPCRRWNPGSMTLLPWFVPRTEPPVKLREVGPGGGYLLTESRGDVHLNMCRCRTGGEDCAAAAAAAAAAAWEAPTNQSLLSY